MMDVQDAIKDRRSIRRFKNDQVPGAILEEILKAATLAPSGKNKQPWKFYVIQGDKRKKLVEHMTLGIQRLESQGINTGSAKNTLNSMAQAPVTVVVFNPFSKHPLLKRDTLQIYNDVVDIQSIGAAIQNMLLTALNFGLGSLWICDIFYGYEEICEWLEEEGQLIAAVSFGFPDVHPHSRPRKPVEEITVYMD